MKHLLPLFQKTLSALKDRTGWSILADYLEEQGDPRAERLRSLSALWEIPEKVQLFYEPGLPGVGHTSREGIPFVYVPPKASQAEDGLWVASRPIATWEADVLLDRERPLRQWGYRDCLSREVEVEGLDAARIAAEWGGALSQLVEELRRQVPPEGRAALERDLHRFGQWTAADVLSVEAADDLVARMNERAGGWEYFLLPAAWEIRALNGPTLPLPPGAKRTQFPPSVWGVTADPGYPEWMADGRVTQPADLIPDWAGPHVRPCARPK